MTPLLRTESCLRILLVLLVVAAALAGGCVDVKVDREAVKVSRWLGPADGESSQPDDAQLPVALHDDEAR